MHRLGRYLVCSTQIHKTLQIDKNNEAFGCTGPTSWAACSFCVERRHWDNLFTAYDTQFVRCLCEDEKGGTGSPADLVANLGTIPGSLPPFLQTCDG